MFSGKALKYLGFSDHDYLLKDDGNGPYIEHWYSEKNQPTVDELVEAEESYNKEYEINKYQRQRKSEYPPLEEQLDYIYHNGVDAWKRDVIDPIKNKYPKPEESK